MSVGIVEIWHAGRILHGGRVLFWLAGGLTKAGKNCVASQSEPRGLDATISARYDW